MLIIPAAINLLLWVVYVVCSMAFLSFWVPSLGGDWSELNTEGKITCIFTGIVALWAMFILVTTTVYPL